MLIKISELEKIIESVLLTEYSPEETQLLKQVVLFGELAGRSTHGIIRLIKGNYGTFVEKQRGKTEYLQKSKVSTLINGNGNPGMLVASLAIQEVCKLAKDNGIGIVGTRNSFNSTGSLTYYLDKIAEEDLIGIILTQSPLVIAPFNSKKALFGSNPIGFAIPAEPLPVIFDMSTSAITYGALMKAHAEGKSIPENVAIDKEGHPTTDPAKAMEGATLAFDASYKGSGLAMMVELLAGLWNGASFEGIHPEKGEGNLFLAFSPDLLSDVSTLKKRTAEFITVLKHIPTRDGKSIRIPGEHSLQLRDENLQKGEIEISDNVWQQLQEQIAK